MGGLVLGLTLGVLVTAGRLPRLEAGSVADHLYDAALRRVVLAGGLAVGRRVRTRSHNASQRDTYLGSEEVLLEDMLFKKSRGCVWR